MSDTKIQKKGKAFAKQYEKIFGKGNGLEKWMTERNRLTDKRKREQFRRRQQP